MPRWWLYVMAARRVFGRQDRYDIVTRRDAGAGHILLGETTTRVVVQKEKS